MHIRSHFRLEIEKKEEKSLTLPVGNQSVNNIFKKSRLIKNLIPAGFEPTTAALLAPRSNQLS